MLVSSLFAGCSGGLEEGTPPDAGKQSPTTTSFQKEMEKNAGNMGVMNPQAKPKNQPAEKKSGP
jgi:hypothetical protein